MSKEICVDCTGREKVQAIFDGGIRWIDCPTCVRSALSAEAVIKEAVEAFQLCASKLESQVVRNPDLPKYYQEVLTKSFAAIESLRSLTQEKP